MNKDCIKQSIDMFSSEYGLPLQPANNGICRVRGWNQPSNDGITPATALRQCKPNTGGYVQILPSRTNSGVIVFNLITTKGEGAVRTFKNFDLPESYTLRTPTGWHVYFGISDGWELKQAVTEHTSNENGHGWFGVCMSGRAYWGAGSWINGRQVTIERDNGFRLATLHHAAKQILDHNFAGFYSRRRHG